MSITAYLYHRNQTPRMETHWHCGRRLGTYQAECEIDRELVEGDLVSLHTEHGIFDDFRVAACDGETALLARAALFTAWGALVLYALLTI